MSGFDKFGWLKGLQSDGRFTDKEYRVGSIICVKFCRGNGTGWSVLLDDIADEVPGGLSRNALKKALGKLVQHGYLEETGRSQGGRGVAAWRAHNLTKPDRTEVRVSGETRHHTTTNPPSQTSKPALVRRQTCTSANAGLTAKEHVTEGFSAPKGTSEGTSKGGGGPTSATTPTPSVPALQLINETDTIDAELVDDSQADDDPEPARYCAVHGANPGPPCNTCKDHREEHKAWKARQTAKELAAIQAAALQREAERPPYRCDTCHDSGVVLNSDGKPGSQPRVCHHDRSWHPMTETELAEYTDLLEQLDQGVA